MTRKYFMINLHERMLLTSKVTYTICTQQRLWSLISLCFLWSLMNAFSFNNKICSIQLLNDCKCATKPQVRVPECAGGSRSLFLLLGYDIKSFFLCWSTFSVGLEFTNVFPPFWSTYPGQSSQKTLKTAPINHEKCLECISVGSTISVGSESHPDTDRIRTKLLQNKERSK